MAVEGGLDSIRRLDVPRLRADLATHGIELDPRKHGAFAPELTPDPTKGA